MVSKNNVKDKKWTLYRHTSPSGKVYIGITSKRNINDRWMSGKGYMKCVAFYNAILKYGWDNIKHEILFTNLSEERAKRLEIELIRHYKSMNISYNITDGGDGHLGHRLSEEAINKIRKAHIGRVASPETKEKMSRSRKGKSIKRLKPVSEETKNKMRLSQLGKKRPLKMSKEIHRENLIVGHKKSCKSVLQIDKNTKEVLSIFRSLGEAARTVGASYADISKCCKGVGSRITVKGYLWRFNDGDRI